MNKGVKICPKCHKAYDEVSAISRRDGETEICPDCGMREGLEDMFAAAGYAAEEAAGAIEEVVIKSKNVNMGV